MDTQQNIQNAVRRCFHNIMRTKRKSQAWGAVPGYHRLDKLPGISMVIDVGVGHRGSPFLYTRFPQAYFISIDPLREAEEILHKYLNSSNSRFIQAAAGKERRDIEFQVSRVPSRSSLYDRVQHDTNSMPVETRKAQMDLLDNLLRGVEIQSPALLKIDIEGGELDCLIGGEETVKSVDYIVLELPLTCNYRNSYRFSEVIAFLAECNFEVFQTLKAGNNSIDLLFSRNDDPIREIWSYGARPS